VSSSGVETLLGAATDTYVVLDQDDRIVSVSPRLHGNLGQWLGHVLWDHLPSAKEICSPCFDEARASGTPVEAVVFYSGRVKRLTAIPAADGLAVHVECLAELDVTTLGTLTRSLAQIEAELAGRACEPLDSPARASLRALP
jgi:hypothetical protein